MPRGFLLVPVLAVVAIGCGPGAGDGDGGGSTAASDTSDDGTTDVVSATGSTSSSGGADDTSTSDGTATASTTDDPASCGVPPFISCDPLDPTECPGEGSQCTFDYHPKGGSWVCGCDFGDQGPWSPCMQSTDPGDDCAAGQICDWASFADLVCLPLCGSDLCGDDFVCYGDLCVPPCDPLGPDTCPDALHCAPTDDAFLCLPTYAQARRPAGPGEPCVAIGHCEHGHLCTPDGADCDGQDCCAAVCDESAGIPCPAGQSCQPVFADPGQSVGVCI